MILYIEPKGYEYGTLFDESGNKFYIMDFAIDFAISDDSGNIQTNQQGITFGDILSTIKIKNCLYLLPSPNLVHFQRVTTLLRM